MAVAAVPAQAPGGALIDRINKRAIVLPGAVAVIAGCLVLPFLANFALVAATQAVAGTAGALFPPALTAIAGLGLAGYLILMPETARWSDGRVPGKAGDNMFRSAARAGPRLNSTLDPWPT